MKGIRVITGLVCLTAWAQSPTDGLMKAVRNNDLTSLKTQLEMGADVNAHDARGNTLLMHAAAIGSPEAVQLLLDRGADVNAKNQFGATALIRGANDPRKAAMLVRKGADVNAATKQGRTPLMIAATCAGCLETVRMLIDKGADVKARDSQGDTALYSAAEVDDLDMMTLLIDRGADAAAPDSSGWTPLMSAAANCSMNGIRLMLSKGADVNAANTFAGEVKFGKIQLIHLTPLMLAAPYCSADVMKALLDAGARINEKDLRQMTPLMLAVASENQDQAVIRLLLASGADVNAKSNMGETALDWAKKFGNPRTIAALEAAGARPGEPFTPPERKAVEPRTASQAAEAAVKLLQRTTTEFFKQSGCVGCHNQPITTMAFSAARRHGVPVEEAPGNEQIRMITSESSRFVEPALQRIETGGFTDTPAYVLFALSSAQVGASDTTDTAAVFLAGAQRRNGSWWLGGTSRSPIQEGVIGRTALAVRALQAYGPPGRKTEFDERIRRARAWIAQAGTSTNDDLAMKMMGLYWAAADAASVQAAARTLIAAQRPDGGWAQNPHLSSDAYATGESLWALREAGVLAAADPVYQRGVRFLLNTQWADGSWYVRSRAVKLQPYFQSGFPYGHDQWISSTATGFAAMALAAAAPEKRAAR